MSLSDGTYQIYNTDVTTPFGSPLYLSRSSNNVVVSGFGNDTVEATATTDEKYTLKFSRGGRYIIARNGQLQLGTKAYEWRIFQIDTDKWKIVATAEDLCLSIPQNATSGSRILLLPQEGLPGQFCNFA
ncbi:ricin-type beta-trefoil lectin domain protein [Ceratobasidium sp. AG-Ba]|nr:ricin-type beta-trefoil lectin domain protein [Ceratobasidium sp. AG-Ba]